MIRNTVGVRSLLRPVVRDYQVRPRGGGTAPPVLPDGALDFSDPQNDALLAALMDDLAVGLPMPSVWVDAASWNDSLTWMDT